MFQKSSLKIYLMIISLTTLAFVLLLYLKVFPALKETLVEISPAQTETMKNRFLNFIIGLLVFILLVNFYFWKLDSKLEREKKEVESTLKINPNDPILQENLKKISNQRKHYITLIKLIFMVVLGLAVGFMIVSLFTPLYPILGV